jgi:uncharacterized protein YuzB (UPF0349 family)
VKGADLSLTKLKNSRALSIIEYFSFGGFIMTTVKDAVAGKVVLHRMKELLVEEGIRGE